MGTGPHAATRAQSLKPLRGSVAIAAGVVAVVGFSIGAFVPHLLRNDSTADRPSQLAVAPVPRRTAAAPRSSVVIPQATALPTVRPIIKPIATTTPRSAPTQLTSAVPLPITVHAKPTAQPASPIASQSATRAAAGRDDSSVNVGVPPGSIRIDETGTSVGTISWSGSARAAGPGTLALDVRKVRVAGRRVGPCEQATHLRAVVAAGAARVPYQEIGCNGSIASGEMQIVASSGDGRSFSGAFYSGGTKLGDFTVIAGSY